MLPVATAVAVTARVVWGFRHSPAPGVAARLQGERRPAVPAVLPVPARELRGLALQFEARQVGPGRRRPAPRRSNRLRGDLRFVQ